MVVTQHSKTILSPLIFRADAGTRIGFGHVRRCSALAQEWQAAGGRAIFLMSEGAKDLEARLVSEGMEIVRLLGQPGGTDDALETALVAQKFDAQWVVADGYNFKDLFQRVIKDSGLQLLFVDDNGQAVRYRADIILNQNLHAHAGLYESREPYTRLLLGTPYALLRREFLKWQGRIREIPDVACNVLVTMGGGDPENITLNVIQALQKVNTKGLDVKVAVGSSNPHYDELRAAVQGLRIPIGLERPVRSMPQLMSWADLAVSAGGTTCWELAFMGVPTCIIVAADNQSRMADALHESGVSHNLGWYTSIDQACLTKTLCNLIRDKKRRQEMSALGKLLIDGRGSHLVTSEIMNPRGQN